ncbi:hypothetical protein [Nocardiopsis alba]|uniref:hypothetical protein n=1 Tax=Nocardiopsis alba TaxID=53437 RepID=UPI0035E1EE72
MSHSTRAKMAEQRAAYTGETMPQARAGVARNDHGLDHCTPEQLHLRSLLALALFNRHPYGLPPADWHAHRLLTYTFHLSPRYDDLVIFTRDPEQAANCFLMEGMDTPVFPGWRATCVTDHHIRLNHVPTGASLGVEKSDDHNRIVCARPCSESAHEHYHTYESPVSDLESMHVGGVPPMSDAARVLLAGLISRLCLTAPDRSWATARWHLRPRGVGSGERSLPEPGRRLWGAHDHWELRWGGFPDAAYVASALTAPVIGIAGASALDRGHEISVRYGPASLILQESSRNSSKTLVGRRGSSRVPRVPGILR